MRLIVYVLFIVIALTGCAAQTEESVLKVENEPTEITLTPVDLFKGEAAKFQPFLGSMTGAFKLRYTGNKPNANLDVDIWKNGEKVDSSGSVGDLFVNADPNTSREIEIIISIETVSTEGQDDKNIIKVSRITDSGSSLFTITTLWDKELTLKAGISNQVPLTFSTEKPVHVWGMQASSTNSMRTGDLSPEALSRIEQAIIFTLRIED